MRALSFVALIATLLPAGIAAAEPIFTENFENGTTSWTAVDGNPIAVGSDTSTCSTSYQHETIDYGGGRVVSNAFPVVSGSDYCVSVWVRATTDATPFLGVRSFDADGNYSGDHWLIGADGFDNGYGGSAVVVASDGAWHWYAANVTLDAASASLQVMDELYLVDSGSADFDDIAVTAGPCTAAYAGADQHQVCGNDFPVCSADGSCQPMPSTGGGSSTPDMGPSSPGVSFPGATSGVSASTPVAAEGSPAGGGAVTTTTMSSGGGGCSMGGSEGERSFGIMLLAFVGVMLAGRRRRA